MLWSSRAALLAPLLVIACGGAGAARPEAEPPSPLPVAARAEAAAPAPAPSSSPVIAAQPLAEPTPAPESVAARGEGGPKDEHAGESAAEADPKPAAPATTGDDVEGANLTMSGVEADGVRLKNITCKTKGSALGGLFGGITVVAGFKSRKARLEKCSPKQPAETRVKWTSTGGRMTKLHAVGTSGARNACVEKALAGALSTVDGVCAATLLHGKK